MRVLVVSGRADHQFLFDACTYDFEDVILDALDATVFTSRTALSDLEASYDMAIVMGVSFQRLADLTKRLLPAVRDRITGPVVGYIFGGYGHLAKQSTGPLRRITLKWPQLFSGFDHLFSGIGNHVDVLSDSFGVETKYLPMAANILGVAARPYDGPGDRPIAVNAFGRQHPATLNAICDRLNHPGSDDLVYYTNLLAMGEAKDLPRYRNMFWQFLRKSRLSVAFDHVYTTPDKKDSYVGPRWFEALAAGTVVIGKAPPSPDCARLLDWTDATIDLSDDPETAADEVLALLEDTDRLRQASRRTLVEMARRHDWSHRLIEMFEELGLDTPKSLQDRCDRLTVRAMGLSKTGASLEWQSLHDLHGRSLGTGGHLTALAESPAPDPGQTATSSGESPSADRSDRISAR